VIAIALKNRAAVLPGGHTANAAYWYDSGTGRFVSSTYYMPALPAWVAGFNASLRRCRHKQRGLSPSHVGG
jgi:hypothetical protein